LVFLHTIFTAYFADVFAGIKKEVEAGSLPANVAAGMEEVYNNYKKAVSHVYIHVHPVLSYELFLISVMWEQILVHS